MTKHPPDYFGRIQTEARSRWEQLEVDPVLAAPWLLLFQQVRHDPRYVVSELLQNADDVGASWARASFEGNTFVFEHDGRDFTKEEFSSLCQFAFSNKRILHTIGYRGIGFKTTFSLSDRVALITPTLRVGFDAARFTEPIWLTDRRPSNETTRIEIVVEDPMKRKSIEDNLSLWAETGLSLLFFTNIRTLIIDTTTLTKAVSQALLPSEIARVELQGGKARAVYVVTSEPQDFPDEAVQEIRSERQYADFDPPPVRLELVLGAPAPQRLYSVLPTSVFLGLPFSCNAPFLQDPGRTGIKSPSVSPTNRWLLNQIGQLAGKTLIAWLGHLETGLEERSKAYDLLLPEPRTGRANSLGDECTDVIIDGLKREMAQRPMLLCTDGSLADAGTCLELPPRLLRVWPDATLLRIFGTGQRKLLAGAVSQQARNRLPKWEKLKTTEMGDIIWKLTYAAPRPPRPDTEDGLACLWSTIEESLQKGLLLMSYSRPAIVPILGGQTLQPSNEVTVKRSSDDELSQDDWTFLSQYAQVVDPQWLSRLEEAERSAQQSKTIDMTDLLQAAQLLKRLGLPRQTNLARAVEQAAANVFERTEPGEAGIRLAYVAARAGMKLPDKFRFRCRDGKWRSIGDGLLTPGTTDLPGLPAEWLKRYTVNEEYVTPEDKKDAATWRRWVGTSDSRLRRFPIPAKRLPELQSRSEVEAFIAKRGGAQPSEYPLSNTNFEVTDYDFDADVISAWENQSQTDPDLWPAICLGICDDWDDVWEGTVESSVHQKGYKRSRPLDHGKMVSTWLKRLRTARCLRDDYSSPRSPEELYRTTPETAHLRNFEPFLHPDYDQPRCATFLELLGVRSRPDDVDRLIERLKMLSAVAGPPMSGLENLYIALDQSIPHLSSAKLDDVRAAFTTAPLIYASDEDWHTPDTVYRTNPDAIPDIPTVRSRLAALRLWDRIDVRPQPSLELLIESAKAIKPGTQLSGAEKQRMLSLLKWAPQRVWADTGCWLTAAGTWSQVKDLRWRSALPGLSNQLFPAVRQATAAIDMLPVALQSDIPFAELTSLEANLENRPSQVELVGSAECPSWMACVASQLLCITEEENRQNDQEETKHRRSEARRLHRTHLQYVSTLMVAPYLDGQPAGPHLSPRVLWYEDVLYLRGRCAAIHPLLSDELAKPFKSSRIRGAIRDCVDRPDEWIREYFKENFDLDLTLLSELFGEESRPDESETTKDRDDAGEGLPPYDPADVEFDPGDPFIIDPFPSPPAPIRPPAKPPGGERERSETPTRLDRLTSYLQARGFRYDAERKVYTRSDGTTIRHAQGSPYPWQEERAGAIRAFYWVGDSSLERGVEIPAEVWTLLGSQPGLRRLLLAHPDGRLTEYTWETYDSRRKAGEIDLFPATYRLTLTASHKG